MELWQKLLMGARVLLMIFFLLPSIKSSMERSKNAEEKHWGTVLLLAAELVACIAFLVSTVQ